MFAGKIECGIINCFLIVFLKICKNCLIYCLIEDNQIDSILNVVIPRTQMCPVDWFLMAWASRSDSDERKINKKWIYFFGEVDKWEVRQ